MTEEDMKKTEASLRSEIEFLKFSLCLVMATLPENHRDYVLARIAERTHRTREEADAKQMDPLFDEADAMFDFEQYVINHLEGEADSFAQRSEFYGIP